MALVAVAVVLAIGACGVDDGMGTTAPTAPTSTTTTSTTSTTSTTTNPSTSSTTTTKTVPVELPIATDDAPPYEVLFSLPADGESVTYEGDPTVSDAPLTGPQAIAVAADGSIWIADTEALRLIRLTASGELLLDVDTDADAVGPLIDVAAYRDGVLGLEAVPAFGRYRLIWYSSQGELVAAGELPPGFHLENGLSGIEVGPSDEIWVELAGGARVYEVGEVEEVLAPIRVGGYRLGTATLASLSPAGGSARFGIGDFVFELPFRELGSLLYEGAVPGAVALLHSNVWLDDVIVVDDTVVFVDEMARVLAEADYPLDEVVYTAQERTAVSHDGRLIALLPRPDRVDVVSLTLYAPGHFGLEG